MKLQLPLDKSHRLVRWANSISAFYGHPLYLVGSQITGKENPSDVDIVCPIPDDEFTLRYGSCEAWCDEGCTGLYTEIKWDWADDCLKRSLSAMRETGLRVDFKIQPYCQFLGYGHIMKAFRLCE